MKTGIRTSELRGCDFSDKEQVIALARKLGRGMTVYKHPDRPNFNITHTSRVDLYQPAWVIAHV